MGVWRHRLYNQAVVRADRLDRGHEQRKKNPPGEAARGAPWREENTSIEWAAMGMVDEPSCRGETDRHHERGCGHAGAGSHRTEALATLAPAAESHTIKKGRMVAPLCLPCLF